MTTTAQTGPAELTDLPLWTQPLTRTERQDLVHRAIVALAPMLYALAVRRGAYGVDAEDTRRLAVLNGWATGGEVGRALSWFAHVPRAAGLVANGLRDEYTPTGNRLTRYTLLEFRL